MKLQRLAFIACLSLMAVMACAADETTKMTFRSETLTAAAKTLELSQLDTLPQGVSTVPFQDFELTIVRSGQRVEHIGRRLFATQLREANPSAVYDYLEYAWLDHTCKLSDNPFLYQSLFFEEGNWKMLEQVNDTVPVHIASENGKRYRVTWNLPNSKDIVLTFPIGYERLSMSSRRELENTLIEDLQNSDMDGAKSQLRGFDKASAVETAAGLWCEKGDHYMIDEINQNRYFAQVKKGMYEPVFDAEHPAESLANLFNGGVNGKPAYGMHLTFRLYENRQQQSVVGIEQLFAFFHQRGCKTYWGLEEINDEQITGTLMIVNEGYGYHHVIGVTCPRQSLFAEKCVMEGSVSLFVPSTNIGNIFYEPEGKKQKIKWQ